VKLDFKKIRHVPRKGEMMFRLKGFQGYLIGAIVGAILGCTIYVMQPVSWKGQVLIRIGQTAKNQGPGTPTIEAIPTVIERIKLHAFAHAVAERAQIKEVEALLDVDQQSGMSAKQTRNGDSIEITVVSSSLKIVQAATEALAAEIVSQHDALFKVYFADTTKELAELEREIEALSMQINLARSKLSKENPAVAAIFILSIQPHLEAKLSRASLLRDSISSSNIRRTGLIDSPSITERHLFSSLWRASLFGALLGILFSTVWIRWKK